MGGGNFGGFKNTKGARNNLNVDDFIIRKKSDVVFDENKTFEEFMNYEDYEDGFKTKCFFKYLGYTKDNEYLFLNDLINSIINRQPNKIVKINDATKCEYKITLIGENGEPINLIIVGITNKENWKITYKIMAIYIENENKK